MVSEWLRSMQDCSNFGSELEFLAEFAQDCVRRIFVFTNPATRQPPGISRVIGMFHNQDAAVLIEDNAGHPDRVSRLQSAKYQKGKANQGRKPADQGRELTGHGTRSRRTGFRTSLAARRCIVNSKHGRSRANVKDIRRYKSVVARS